MVVAQVAVVPDAVAFEMSRSEYGARLRLTSLPARVRLDTPVPGFADGGRAALLRAIASWNARSSSSVVLVLTDDDVDVGIEIVAVSENWKFGSAIAAHTAVESDSFHGDIRHAVIEIDAHRNWSDAPDLPANAVDLKSVFLHELGHALGLAHSPHDDAVMRAGIKPGQTRRRLHEDDAAGIVSITNEAGLGKGTFSSNLRRAAVSMPELGLIVLFFVVGVGAILIEMTGRAARCFMTRQSS